MGKLYVIPTPVGNLEDITFRALRLLKEVDLILAGHTHGGQICLPNGDALTNSSRYKVKFNYPMDSIEGKDLLISKGVGCSALPVRFFCEPEIVILTLE